MKLDLYIITDEEIAGLSHLEIVRRAIAGAPDVIQLRDKASGCRELVRVGQALREMTRDTGVLFIVNDRLDIALACGADGVHLGQGDTDARTARQLSNPGFIIGVTVGTLEDAVRAESDGADYVAVSPVYLTASKDDAGPPRGLDLVRRISQGISIPVIAIGGINEGNVADVIEAGADGIAVISAVVGSADITAATRALKGQVMSAKERKERQGNVKVDGG